MASLQLVKRGPVARVSAATLTPIAVVRAKIEAMVEAPALLAVTSALPTDGSRVLVQLLAQSFVDAAERVLVIDAISASEAGLAPIRRSHELQLFDQHIQNAIIDGGGVVPDLLHCHVPEGGGGWSLATTRLIAKKLSERYRYIIVNAPEPATNAFSLAWLARANAVIVSVRHRRRIHRVADAALRTTIPEQSRVMGVLSLRPALIDCFTTDTLDEALLRMPTVREETRPPRLLEKI